MPFVDEPPRPQLFRPLSSVENADEVLRAAFAQSAQFHLVKISAPESAWDDVKTRWDAFTQTVKEADGLTALFAGEGISHDEGVFLGLTGWANLGALERALRTADVAAKLEELEVAAGPDVSSTFIFDFNRDI